MDQVSLDADNLQGIPRHPRAAFQRGGMNCSVHAIGAHRGFAILALTKMNLPCRYPPPRAETFTTHFKIIRVHRMENQNDCRQTGGRQAVRKYVEREGSVSVLIHIQNAGPNFTHRYQVVEPETAASCGSAVLVDDLVFETLRGGVAV